MAAFVEGDFGMTNEKEKSNSELGLGAQENSPDSAPINQGVDPAHDLPHPEASGTSMEPEAAVSEKEPAEENSSQSGAAYNEDELAPRSGGRAGTGAFLRISLVAAGLSLLGLSVLGNINYLSRYDLVLKPVATGYWVLMIGLVFITGASILVALWLSHARTVLLRDGPALVPEKWGGLINELARLTMATSERQTDEVAKIAHAAREQSEQSKELLESFLSLQKTLDARDAEIERLKKGHDAVIFKKFILRFAKIDRRLREFESEAGTDEDAKKFRNLSRLMENALEECGVERIRPELGMDYTSVGPEVADDPVIVDTDKAEEDQQIAEVLSEGYVVTEGTSQQVIEPARVSIFRHIKRDEEQD